MLLDDSARCAGTRQPGSSAILSLCLGCTRYTLGPASLSALAYLDGDASQDTSDWTCDERRASGVSHEGDARRPVNTGASQEVGGEPRTTSSGGVSA